MSRTDPPRGFDPDGVNPPPLSKGPWRISALALDVAGNCNLACRYCAEAATQPRRWPMSQETLEAAWGFLFSDGQPKQGTSIRLGSGEPLLAFPLLRKLGKLVKRERQTEGRNGPTVFLTTNGTLVDDKVRNWLISSGWYIKLSLDGPSSIHDKWRVTPSGEGTFEQVCEAVTNLAYSIPDRFSVTSVLCRGADPAEIFEAIAGLGVRRIEFVPVAHQHSSVLPNTDDVERYERFVKNYARRYLDHPEGTDIPTLVRIANCVVRLMGYGLQRIPCGAGRSFIGVGPDGNLYPCFRFIGLELYRIGRLATGLDAEALTAFQCGPGRPYEQRTPCHECWAAPLCGGPCFACSEMFGPGDGQPLSLHCAYTLADARAAVWLVNQLRQRAPERLLGFLPVIKDIMELV